MKTNFLTCISLIAFSGLIHSQQDNWRTYRLDLPDEMFVMDTTMRGIKIHTLFSKVNNSTFIAQKTQFEDDDINKNLSELPYDSASLEKVYNGVIEGMVNRLAKKLKSKESVTYDTFKGYHLAFADSTGILTYEVEFYLLNNYLYSLIYTNNVDSSSVESDRFFKSLKIMKTANVTQFAGQEPGYRFGYRFAMFFLAIPVILLILLIRHNKSRKSKRAEQP